MPDLISVRALQPMGGACLLGSESGHSLWRPDQLTDIQIHSQMQTREACPDFLHLLMRTDEI